MTDEEIVSLFIPMYNSFQNLALPTTERPQFLAHYTTLEVLEKILKDDEVWFSNPLFMNDYQEMRFGMVEGLKAFDKIYLEPWFESACGSKDRAARIRAAFYQYFQHFDLNYALDVYVFCLAEHDPKQGDGRLSMWRGYGANGNGVALVFKTDFIKVNGSHPLLGFKVIYESDEERIAWISIKFRECIEILNRQHIADEKLHIVAHQMFGLMEIYSLISKHPGFSEESEWRIIYLPERDTRNILKDRFHYVIGKHGVELKLKVKIAPLPIPPEETWTFDSILHQIILGPGLSTSLSANAIRKMLDVNKKPEFKQKLWPSGIPLRATK